MKNNFLIYTPYIHFISITKLCGLYYVISYAQRTWTDFFVGDKTLDLPYNFLLECHVAHTIYHWSYCAVTMASKVPLLDYFTPIFYWTEVSAHGLIF